MAFVIVSIISFCSLFIFLSKDDIFSLRDPYWLKCGE